MSTYAKYQRRYDKVSLTRRDYGNMGDSSVEIRIYETDPVIVDMTPNDAVLLALELLDRAAQVGVDPENVIRPEKEMVGKCV